MSKYICLRSAVKAVFSPFARLATRLGGHYARPHDPMAKIVLTESQLLREMVAHELHSRKEVCERLQVSKPSVTRVVERLMRRGLIEEGERFNSQRRGRKTNALHVRRDLAYFLGTDLDGMALRACMLDSSLQVISSGKCTIDLRDPIEKIIGQWNTLVHDVIRMSKVPMKKIVGSGVGVSRVLATDSVKTRGFFPPGKWVDIDVAQVFKKLDLPIALFNNALCVAEYERRLGAASKARDFAAVLVRHGIGAVLFHGGAFLLSRESPNNKFGHVKVAESREKCSCGEYGCLDTFCSGRTWPDAWRRRGPEWEADLRSRARYLGIGIASLLDTLYVPLVIINGIYNEYESVVYPSLMEQIAASMAAVDQPVPKVVMSTGGEFNTSIGAALLGIDRFMDSYLRQQGLANSHR